MPIILMKILTNKYVLLGVAIFSLFAYIKWLNTSLSDSRKEAQGYSAIAKEQSLHLQDLERSYAKEREALKLLSDTKQTIQAKTEHRVIQIPKLEKVYVIQDSKCTISDDAFIMLADAYKDANESSKPAK